MSKSKSKWRNFDGKTVKTNTLAEQWSSRPVGLLESPAFRVLSKAEHLALSRIEIMALSGAVCREPCVPLVLSASFLSNMVEAQREILATQHLLAQLPMRRS
jgi:hypothetical protein